MARVPTVAQRRVVEAADPATGRLRGTAPQLAALVRLGLAFRHPRPPHDCFLTPAGHRLREAVPDPAQPPARTDAPASRPPAETGAATASGGFAARTGDPGAPADGPDRRHEVRSAWQGLVELRRMTNPVGATDRPCPWERAHLVSAAALALEAAGCVPACATAEGYRVRETPQPEAVAVHAPGDADLRACCDALETAGWQTGAHIDPRTRSRYVLASPRRG